MSATPITTFVPQTIDGEEVIAPDFQAWEDVSRNLAGYSPFLLFGTPNLLPMVDPVVIIPSNVQGLCGLGVMTSGNYIVLGARYIDFAPATTLSLSPAPGSGSRVDLLCGTYAQVPVDSGFTRPNLAPDGSVSNQELNNLFEGVIWTVVTGTPAISGATPSLSAVPPNYVPVASITVPSGTVSICGSNIEQLLPNALQCLINEGLGAYINAAGGSGGVIFGSLVTSIHTTPAIDYATTDGFFTLLTYNGETTQVGFGLKVKTGAGPQIIGGRLFIGKVTVNGSTKADTSGSTQSTDWTFTVPEDGTTYVVDFFSKTVGSDYEVIDTGTWLPRNTNGQIDISGFSSLTPTLQSPSLVVSPPNPSIVLGLSQLFTATYLDQNLTPQPANYSWATTLGVITPGSPNQTATLNTTGVTPGGGTLTVTATPTDMSLAPITVTVPFTVLPPYTLSFSTTQISVDNGGSSSAPITAFLRDNHGNNVSGVVFIWSLLGSAPSEVTLSSTSGQAITVFGRNGASVGTFPNTLQCVATVSGLTFTGQVGIRVTQFNPPPPTPPVTGQNSGPGVAAITQMDGSSAATFTFTVPNLPAGYNFWQIDGPGSPTPGGIFYYGDLGNQGTASFITTTPSLGSLVTPGQSVVLTVSTVAPDPNAPVFGSPATSAELFIGYTAVT